MESHYPADEKTIDLWPDVVRDTDVNVNLRWCLALTLSVTMTFQFVKAPLVSFPPTDVRLTSIMNSSEIASVTIVIHWVGVRGSTPSQYLALLFYQSVNYNTNYTITNLCREWNHIRWAKFNSLYLCMVNVTACYTKLKSLPNISII